MIKLEVYPQVLMSLNQAFPKPNMAATKALNKYVQVLEKLLFEAWLHGPTPEQRKLKLFGLSLYQLMAKGGQIGPNKIRIHKWLKDQKLELVQAVTKGSNLTGRLSEVKLTDLVTMTNNLELKEEITMNIHNITERDLPAYSTATMLPTKPSSTSCTPTTMTVGLRSTSKEASTRSRSMPSHSRTTSFGFPPRPPC